MGGTIFATTEVQRGVGRGQLETSAIAALTESSESGMVGSRQPRIDCPWSTTYA
jgi:hypothetical protein